MQPIEIFRAGTHTAMDGRTLTYAEADLIAAAAAYDPALSEAPIVVGHPRDNGPAWGWVASLGAEAGRLRATPHQVEPAFAEAVRAGRYKKVSASFYLPDSPANPKPGSLYLRHVGFLGAQPPAVKGLADVQFAEADGIVEFADGWSISVIARLFGGLREMLLTRFGAEAADAALPRETLDALQRDAGEMLAGPAVPPAAYSEPQEPAHVTTQPDLAAREAALAANAAAVAAREAAVAAQERAARAAEDAAFCERLVAEGRLLPAQRPATLALLGNLPADGPVEFGESLGTVPPRDAFRAFLAGGGQVVEFGEVAPGNRAAPFQADPRDAANIRNRALEYQEDARKRGLVVSDIDAIQAVIQGALT